MKKINLMLKPDNMKTFLTLMLAVLTMAGFSQKKPKLSKVESAIQNANYAEAKMIVDEAIVHEKTKDSPETWFLRGQVYAALDTANNEPGALEESLKAFDKTMELDPEQKKISEIDFTTGMVSNVDSKKQGYYTYYYNAAITAYNEQDFASAAKNFETSFYIMPSDTNAILNAAYAASAADMDDKARENFAKAAEAGSRDKNIYLQLYNYAIQDKDLELALTEIQKGREVYPEDVDMMKYEVNLFIQLERTEEARTGLIKAIDADPSNADLHFALGVLLEETEEFDGAVASYKKALENDPNHYNSNFNYAVYVFNQANEMIKESNTLSYYPGKRNYKSEEKKKYDDLQVGIKDKLEESLPLWEKLYSLQSTDKTVLETLGYIYKNLEMKEKASKINAELEAIQE